MPFPLKFRDRLELTKKDIDIPQNAWLVYAVCGCEADSCGWEGWILESVIKTIQDKDIQLKYDHHQICPNCAKTMFRTDTKIKMKYSKDQSGLLTPGIDYETDPMKYE
jgi:hypothetical protein